MLLGELERALVAVLGQLSLGLGLAQHGQLLLVAQAYEQIPLLDGIAFHELDRVYDARDLRLHDHRCLGLELSEEINPVVQGRRLDGDHLDRDRRRAGEGGSRVLPTAAEAEQQQRAGRSSHGSEVTRRGMECSQSASRARNAAMKASGWSRIR